MFSMDTEAAYHQITENIKDGHEELVYPQIRQILDYTGKEPMEYVKCASILKSIDDEDDCQQLLDELLAMVDGSDEEGKVQIASSLRRLGRGEDSYDILKDIPDADPYEYAMSLYASEEYESALSVVLDKQIRTVPGRVLLCDTYCALGEFTKAMAEAQSLLDEEGPVYDVLVNMANVMFRKGDGRGAAKFVKGYLKTDKQNFDYLAACAYVMRITGKIPAAVNYSVRVVNKDQTHIGAMETLALCHVEKKSFMNAKIIAGRINEVDPGNPAVVRIIDACRILSS